MTVQELKEAVLALNSDDQKSFLLQALPELAEDALQDRAFMLDLFPVLIRILKSSGIDMQQLLQMATAMSSMGLMDND